MTYGVIFDIKKYAIHDGPGIRTTIFLKGCPMNCLWCHNPESRNPKIEKLITKQKKESFGKKITIEKALKEIMKDKIFYDESKGGVTFSGGEPMMQINYLYSLAKACKKEKINTALDTCGYAPSKDFIKISNLIDLFLYDIKIIDDELHKEYTGVSNQIILKNLKFLDENNSNIELRIPLIPNITDTNHNLLSIIKFIDNLHSIENIRLLPYNKIGEYKINKFNLSNKLGKLKTQTEKDLKNIKEKFEKYGYNVKIGG